MDELMPYIPMVPRAVSVSVIERVIGEAQKSPHPSQHHGAALLLKNGHIIYGYNHGFTHAEKHVVIKAGRRANGATLIVVRAKADGRLKNSRPCENCMKLVEKYDLTAWHSDSNGELVKLVKKISQ